MLGVLSSQYDGDLTAAFEAVGAHRLPFWDAMLWASAQRAGVRCLLTEDLQDGFVLQSVRCGLFRRPTALLWRAWMNP